MTKPISRKMAVQATIYRFITDGISVSSATRGAVCHIPCGICGAIIFPEHEIQFDHIHADVFDGPHEYQNLRPVHAECHKKKTARDIKDNAKVKRLQAGGRKPRGPKLKSKGFNKQLTRKMSGEVVKRNA